MKPDEDQPPQGARKSDSRKVLLNWIALIVGILAVAGLATLL